MGARASRSAGEKTRERILDAALPLFAAHGFAGTSTRMVASAAGVNVATLAYHFSDKEGLYSTVVQRLHEDLAAALPTRLPPEPPRALAGYIAERAWAFVRAHRTHIRMSLRHLLDQGNHPQVVIDRWQGPLLDRADFLVGLLRPDWSSTERRLLVLSVIHLLVRFAVEDPDTLHSQLGGPANLDDAVVRWFAGLLERELGLE